MAIVAKFATPGSGALADKIGWFDFGPGFILVPGASPVHVINELPDGYTVEFDVSLISNAAPVTNFTAAIPPASASVAFGNTGYTGIGGQVVLWSNVPSPPLNERVNIANIAVKNSLGAATTAFPVISGLGTATVLQTGVTNSARISGPVYITNAPDSISGTVASAGQRMGYAFGIIVIDRCQAVNDLIESVALEQTALCHILNAEGEKIQKVVANGTIDQIAAINESAAEMLKAITKLQLNLHSKVKTVACAHCPEA